MNNFIDSVTGILYALPDSEKSLLGALQCLCEQWWEKGLEGKEQFGKTAFLMLLKNNLEKKTLVVCLDKHLYELSNYLYLI